MTGRPALDPVCLFHGKRRSEHDCLYCEICYRSDLTPDDCAVDEQGQKWSVCKGQCAREAGIVER